MCVYGYAVSKIFPTRKFKWIDPKEFNTNKCAKNNSRDCVLEVDLKCPKELCELCNDYILAPDEIETKKCRVISS